MSELVAGSSSLDRVYHFTGHTALQSIMEQGLIVKWVRGDVRWRSAEMLLDSQRPEEFIVRGIARATGVFTHPDLEAFQFKDSAGTIGAIRNAERPVALAIDVDPEEALVLDGGIVFDVFLDIGDGDLEIARDRSKEYWANAMTLATYRRSYDLEVGESELLHHLRPDAMAGLPVTLSAPEVIVPGPIDPARLEWVASSATQPVTMSMPRQVAS